MRFMGLPLVYADARADAAGGNGVTDIIHRNAVRAILLTPEREVLLMRIRLEERPPFWITPGGGIEDGESPEDALGRELDEEVGLTAFELGPLLWLRRHTFSVGQKRYRQNEDYYAVQVPRFDPVIRDATEASVLDRFRWWPLEELHALDEPVAPASLATIVAGYLRAGPPTAPLIRDVTVD